MGERIEALRGWSRRWRAAPARLFHAGARTRLGSARTRSNAARAVSISVDAGTFARRVCAPARARLACASARWPPPATLAWAVASAAREQAIWSRNGVESRPASGLLHRVVHVHQHARHRAPELAADVDRARRLQRAVGADTVTLSVARCTGFGDVARCQWRRAGRSATRRRRARAGSRGPPPHTELPPRRAEVRRAARQSAVSTLALVFMRSLFSKRAAASSRRPGLEEAHVVRWPRRRYRWPRRVLRGELRALRGQHGLPSRPSRWRSWRASSAALSVGGGAQARCQASRSPCGATSASSTSLSAVSTLARWPALPPGRECWPAGHRF